MQCSSKFQSQFFIELKKSLFTGNTEKPRVAKTIMNYKRTSGGIIIEDLKLQKEV